MQSQQAVINKFNAIRTESSHACEIAQAKRNRLENIGIEYEDRLQDHRAKKAKLIASHQDISENMHNPKLELEKAREPVVLAKSEVHTARNKIERVQSHADGWKFPSIKDLAEFLPLF